jgi:lysozyme family protein
MNYLQFDLIASLVINVEGVFTNSPEDSGNWTGGTIGVGKCNGTKYGISAASYPTLDIAALTIDSAKAIYYHDYYSPIRGDQLPAAVSLILFDCAVNQGVGAAIRVLQDATGSVPDGEFGPLTLAGALRMLPKALVEEIAARRALLYARDSGLSTFGLGWYRRLLSITASSLAIITPSVSGSYRSHHQR